MSNFYIPDVYANTPFNYLPPKITFEEEKFGPWIQTYSGKRFYFRDPNPDDLSIEDIAQALSKQCRFAGHVQKFYSVAEHSVLVSYMTLNPLEGLLHDASEAFIVDMPSPIKAELKGYQDVEEVIMKVIAEKFGFAYPMSDDLHDADKAQLIEEARHLLKNCEWINDEKYKALNRQYGILPMCWEPQEACDRFIQRFNQVKG